MHRRYLTDQINSDLDRKMVFLGGPRQVGKTTLSKSLLNDQPSGYLNWDIAHDRTKILDYQFPNTNFWVFDEIHKFRDWRNYMKGVYDEFGQSTRLLVTGSARLDYYRFGGDSLQGRYYYIRLHPLSAKELSISNQEELNRLFQLGGFPEPYFSDSETEAKRWSSDYRMRLIEEDVVSLESVSNLGKLEQLMLRLPDLVGSPLSINSLREDLNVSHKTMSHWLDIMGRLYAIFRLSPFGAPAIRAVKKEQKHYHYDWTLIDEPGPRFENLVAAHLLKWVHFEQDTTARSLDLRYFRDTDGREVDFIITEKNIPIYAIECKYSNKSASKDLIYFKKKFPDINAFQVSFTHHDPYITKLGIRHVSALEFLNSWI